MNKSLKVLAVDVRGTLIDPYQDLLIDPALVNSLWQFLNAGGFIGIITATSLQSLRKLVIPPLMSRVAKSPNSSSLSRFILYVDSGTAAYTLNVNGEAVALEGYSFVSFTERQVKAIIDAIEASSSKFLWPEAVWKVKAGQINYYCGGTFEQRVDLAGFLKTELHCENQSGIFVMVPSAKNTIDIALRNKSYPTLDLLSRSRSDASSLLILGDSLQINGADFDMLLAAPEARAIQVGPQVPSAEVRHLSDHGPSAAQSVFREVLP